MNYEKLKKHGKLVAERDCYSGFAYLYTEEFYECNNKLYFHATHPNAFRYTGQSYTYCMSDDLQKELETNYYEYFREMGLSEEGYLALCTAHSVEAEFLWK